MSDENRVPFETLTAPREGYRVWLWASYKAPTPKKAAAWFRTLLDSDADYDEVSATVMDAKGRCMEFVLKPYEHEGKTTIYQSPWCYAKGNTFFVAVASIDTDPEDEPLDHYDAAVQALHDLREAYEVNVWWDCPFDKWRERIDVRFEDVLSPLDDIARRLKD